MWHRSAAVAVCSALALSVGASATPSEPSAAEAFLKKEFSGVHCQEGMSDALEDCKSSNKCMVRADMSKYRSCREYCDKQGLLCEDAWDNERNSCTTLEHGRKGCDYSGAVSDSDLLCFCKPDFKTRLERFEKFDRLNCYAAKGGFETDLHHDKNAATAEKCAKLCDDDPTCDGFVWATTHGNWCYRRSNVDLLLCEELKEGSDVDYTFYLKRRITM